MPVRAGIAFASSRCKLIFSAGPFHLRIDPVTWHGRWAHIGRAWFPYHSGLSPQGHRGAEAGSLPPFVRRVDFCLRSPPSATRDSRHTVAPRTRLLTQPSHGGWQLPRALAIRYRPPRPKAAMTGDRKRSALIAHGHADVFDLRISLGKRAEVSNLTRFSNGSIN